jgi:type VI secretion system protein ImpH
MAGESRSKSDDLGRRLFDNPTAFEFHQAVRLLEHYVAPDASIRFIPSAQLGFPSAEVESLWFSEFPSTVELVSRVVALVGATGELPSWYSDFALERQKHRDTTFDSFLALFSSRLTELYFQAWARYTMAPDFEREAVGIGVARTTELLSALAEVDIPESHSGCDALLSYAGIVGRRPVGAVSLEGILTDFLNLPVKVREFELRFFQLSADQVFLLGRDGQAQTLDGGAVLGDAVWSRNASFAIEIGPVPPVEVSSLMPGQELFDRLKTIIRSAVGPSLLFSLELIVQVDDGASCRLGSGESQLGWTTWLPLEESIASHRIVISAAL